VLGFAVPSVTSYAYVAYPEINAIGVLAYTNAQRYRGGLPLLSTNDALSRTAATKLQDLFARQYFAHESPSGESVADLAKRAGYAYLAVGENLALGDFSTSRAVVEAWMDSPGHRKNILSETYSEIGIAAGRSYYDGRYTWIIVQAFGLPKSSCPSVNIVLNDEIKAYEERLELLETIAQLREKARFTRVSAAGMKEAAPHDVVELKTGN